jgi:hypothetical protein
MYVDASQKMLLPSKWTRLFIKKVKTVLFWPLSGRFFAKFRIFGYKK